MKAYEVHVAGVSLFVYEAQQAALSFTGTGSEGPGYTPTRLRLSSSKSTAYA
jgi:hypothetical protein